MLSTWQVTATALNLRVAPQVGSPIVAVMKQGDLCTDTGAPATQAGWLAVAYQGRLGHANAQYLRSVPDAGAMAPGDRPVPTSPPAPAPVPITQPSARQSDLALLHPRFRQAVAGLLASLAQAGAPFRVFESYRTPERQKWLYDQGRTRPGSIVTKAPPWRSMHQYGLAADLVLFIDGQWSWRDSGPLAAHWALLRQHAAAAGLRTLSWEAPHVEWPVSLEDAAGPTLMASGDAAWLDNMEASADRWQQAGHDGAPVLAALQRPGLAPA